MISVSHLLLYLYFVNSVTSRKHSSEGIICANFHWYYHDLIDSNWWNCSNVQYLFRMVPEFSLQNDFKKSFVWIEHLPITLICLLFKRLQLSTVHEHWTRTCGCVKHLSQQKTWFWSCFLQRSFRYICDVTHFSWLSNPSLPHITTFHTIIIFMTKMVSHLWMAQKVDRNVVVCTFLCPNREASATIDVVSRSYSLNENMIDTWSGIRICVVTSKTIFPFSKYAVVFKQVFFKST